MTEVSTCHQTHLQLVLIIGHIDKRLVRELVWIHKTTTLLLTSDLRIISTYVYTYDEMDLHTYFAVVDILL